MTNLVQRQKAAIVEIKRRSLDRRQLIKDVGIRQAKRLLKTMKRVTKIRKEVQSVEVAKA